MMQLTIFTVYRIKKEQFYLHTCSTFLICFEPFLTKTIVFQNKNNAVPWYKMCYVQIRSATH
jgi:hypothetical protein